MYDNMFQQMGISTSTHDDLLTAAATNDTQKAIKAIKDGVDVNYVPRDKSILFVAIENNSTEIVDLLLKNGAKVNRGNRMNWTPLHEAINQNDTELVNKLISYNASLVSLDDEDISPLFLMIKNKNYDLLKDILDNDPEYIDVKDTTGDNILAQSIKIRDLEAVELLMTYSPNLETRNNEGNTVIQIAQDWPEILPILKTESMIVEEEKAKQQVEAEAIKKQLEEENTLGITKVSKKKRNF